MRTGISSASLYPQLHTEAAVVSLAAMGCRDMEVFLQTRSEFRVQYVKRLQAVCNQLAVKVHSVHAPSSHFEPLLFYTYKRQVGDGFDTLNRVLEAAARLGSDCYTFHGPLRVTNVEPDRILERIIRVAELARTWGVKLALENVSWCLGWQPKVFRWLLKQNISNLYFTFDNKQAARSGYPDREFLDAMAPALVNVHLSDVSERGSGLLPGHGEVDFTKIFADLQAIDYTGPVILEVYGFKVEAASQLRAAWRQLKKSRT
ncbi:MAG: sugar phosphate isomerase/epimerase [Firmicutes bacterium]|nr:sugar phosphate isomerase/epimerase [Bacillota bacterium]